MNLNLHNHALLKIWCWHNTFRGVNKPFLGQSLGQEGQACMPKDVDPNIISLGDFPQKLCSKFVCQSC